MLPTLLGLVIFAIGFVILLTRSMQALLVFTMICTLMSGSAAFVLVALGGSSIPPSMLAMGLLLMRGFQNEPGKQSEMGDALRQSIFYIIFTMYAVMSAFLLPRLFFHKIDVVPLKSANLRSLYDVFPLEPSSQNITSAFYIVGSMMLCLTTYLAIRRRMGAVYFVRGAIAVVFIHSMFGIMNVVLPTSIWTPISSVFRNGSYAVLDQSIGQVVRIAGIMPETSSYSGYGFCWFVLVTEFWLRDVMPKTTGFAAILLGTILAASTSSTAYVSLGAYFVVLVLRMIFIPKFIRFDKTFALGAFALFLSVIIAAMMITSPAVVDMMVKILRQMTVEKADSLSGQQRAFWAKQGLAAFKASYGLGIGAGSFRSSSLITAIIGSVGVVGTTAIVLHLLAVFQPWSVKTFSQNDDPMEAVGIAAAWAAMFAIVASSFGAASPDPGPSFAIFAGAALGLRTTRMSFTGRTRQPALRPAVG